MMKVIYTNAPGGQTKYQGANNPYYGPYELDQQIRK